VARFIFIKTGETKIEFRPAPGKKVPQPKQMTDSPFIKKYDLSSFADDGFSRQYLKRAMDGINKAAAIYPSAWQQVASGELIRANKFMGTDGVSPVATIVFKEMEEDAHSGFTASWTITNITWIANGMPSDWETSGIPEHIRGLQ
jgi:hypothetical protein